MKATTSRSLFRQSVSVGVEVAAPPQRVWALLTEAQKMPQWNSTVTSVGGTIAAGERLAVRVPSSPRTFTPKVSAFDPPRRMVWRDGAAPMFEGVREYQLLDLGGGRTRFEMTETFSGLMLPMIAPSLPDFAPIFETYAADLKRAAES